MCGPPVWNLFHVILSKLRIFRRLLGLWKTVAPYMLSLIVVADGGVVDTSCKERQPIQKDAIYAVVVLKSIVKAGHVDVSFFSYRSQLGAANNNITNF
jgi:hypothetical protein